jgi:hypothetical protein
MKNRIIHRCFVPTEKGEVSRAVVPFGAIPVDILYENNVVYVVFQAPDASFGLNSTFTYNIYIAHNTVPFDIPDGAQYLGTVLRGIGDHIDNLGNMIYTWSVYYQTVA